MHLDKSAARRRTHICRLTAKTFSDGQPNTLLPMRSRFIALFNALLASQAIIIFLTSLVDWYKAFPAKRFNSAHTKSHGLQETVAFWTYGKNDYCHRGTKAYRSRANISLDGAYAFSLDKLTAAWLKPGIKLNEQQIAQLLAKDEQQAHTIAPLHFCFRSRSNQEVQTYLERKGVYRWGDRSSACAAGRRRLSQRHAPSEWGREPHYLPSVLVKAC